CKSYERHVRRGDPKAPAAMPDASDWRKSGVKSPVLANSWRNGWIYLVSQDDRPATLGKISGRMT
ncbi:hypothetical protein ACC736_38090, partial [Rhizobium ruizarguesonis]